MASHLGGKSVKQWQQEVDSSEFAEWIAYNNRNPFMIDRVEYSIAILTALIANIHSKNKTFTFEDFLLKQREPKQQSALVMEKTLEALYGGNKQSIG